MDQEFREVLEDLQKLIGKVSKLRKKALGLPSMEVVKDKREFVKTECPKCLGRYAKPRYLKTDKFNGSKDEAFLYICTECQYRETVPVSKKEMIDG